MPEGEPRTQDEFLQFVVIQLEGEEYGIPIMSVETLIRMSEVTRIPRMPSYVEGVINLRGRIIPLIDLRERFGFEKKEWDDKTRIAVIDSSRQSIGLVADGVTEVIRLARKQIDPIPPSLSRIGEEYLDGVGKAGNRLIILLNVDKIVSELEKTAIQRMTRESR